MLPDLISAWPLDAGHDVRDEVLAAYADPERGYHDTTHLAERHVHMTERRFSKLDLLKDGTFESANTEWPVAVMPWGGSKGPTREAFDELQDLGVTVGWYYTMYLNPLPTSLLEELRQKELVLVPEL